MTTTRTAQRPEAAGSPAGSPLAEEPCDHQDEPYAGQLSLRYAEGDWSLDTVVCVRCGRERTAA